MYTISEFMESRCEGCEGAMKAVKVVEVVRVRVQGMEVRVWFWGSRVKVRVYVLEVVGFGSGFMGMWGR